jgi:hypothetical protein
VSSVQVVVHETPQVVTKLWLVDSEGVVLSHSSVRDQDALKAEQSEELLQVRE